MSHPDGKARETVVRDDIREVEISLTWSEIMRHRGYSEEEIAAMAKRRDEKMFGDLK